MSASRSLTGCPCSGCDATRVLADVEKALDVGIRHCEKAIADAQCRIADHESLMSRAEYVLAALTEVRRVARGGRDGGAST